MLKGTRGANATHVMVQDFFTRRALAHLGCETSYDSLTELQIAAFTVIANEVERHRAGK